MIDLMTIDEDVLTQTMRYMRRHFAKRSWKAEVPYVGSVHCYVTRSDGKTFHIFSATPPTTTYAAGHLANDKFATHQVLAMAGIPQLDTMLFVEDLSDEDILEFIQRYNKIVVKPVDGGHGRGITVNISDVSGVREAVRRASEAGRAMSTVLLQQQYPHSSSYDVRLLCIDFRFVAAIWRVPARVKGDGTHTVRQLIEVENRTHRGKAYYAPLASIDIENAQRYLGQGIERVPAVDEMIQVLGIANYGAGGETIDITDAIPSWLARHAEKAAHACELPVAGVDFLLATSPSKDMHQKQLDPVLIEINKCPLLAMHDFPTSGKSRHVIEQYVDYLASL